jgi:hypothetical protein
VDKKTGIVSDEKRYYISSSAGSAEEMLSAVRIFITAYINACPRLF